MKVAEYKSEYGSVDKVLRNQILIKKQYIHEKNDDSVVLIIGDTGSGKSELALNIMDIYLGESLNPDLIGLCRPSIARAVRSVKNMSLPRCALFDEANINKRDSLTKFNRDVMDLFMAIRGLNIFWLWCNPSAEMIDKFFIKERIAAIIYVRKQDIGIGDDRRRVYYFFKQKKILQIFEKYGNLDIKTIKKVRKKYAWFRGWFKVYNGKIKDAYLQKKKERMEDKTDIFCEKYGKEDLVLSKSAIARKLGISHTTVQSYFNELLDNNRITIEEHYERRDGGIIKYKEAIIPLLAEVKNNRYKHLVKIGKERAEKKYGKKKINN